MSDVERERDEDDAFSKRADARVRIRVRAAGCIRPAFLETRARIGYQASRASSDEKEADRSKYERKEHSPFFSPVLPNHDLQTQKGSEQSSLPKEAETGRWYKERVAVRQ